MSTDFKSFNGSMTTQVVPEHTFYERLEFLGDSIIDLVVVEYVYERYGSKDEGTLSALKQAAVSNKALGMIAIHLGLHHLILMDNPENEQAMKSEFEKIEANFNAFLNNPEALIEAKLQYIKVLGDVLEALIGAIFLDVGLDYPKTKETTLRITNRFLMHFTNMETMKKSSRAKLQNYLDNNNYRECRMKKDEKEGIVDGMFKFLLVDRTGAEIDGCWETSEKKAWDFISEKFNEKNKEAAVANGK
jgi:endoribonuclease Dicer